MTQFIFPLNIPTNKEGYLTVNENFDYKKTKPRSMAILLRDFMSAPVTTCTTDADVGKVRDLMKLKEFSALPVVDVVADMIEVRGIITYRDIAGVYDDNVNAQQIMTSSIRVVPPEMTAKEAASLMRKFQIHHLVVVEEGRIVGLVSSADYVSLVAQYDLQE